MIYKIKEKDLSRSDNILTSSPSALKYLYSGGIDCIFSFRDSGVISLFSNCLDRLNHVGMHQYTAIVPITAKNNNISYSVSITSDKREIIPTPAPADLSITFLSLLRKFPTKVSILVRSLNKVILLQESLKVSIFIINMLCFFSFSSAHATEECLTAITKYEKLYKIPTGLLKAISKVESEYNPLALNDGLKQHNFKTRKDALERISYLREIGKTNFDIGCMQINYYWHGNNFASIDAMLDVTENVRYAASLIHSLYKTHGNWQAAVRHYHSSDPKFYKLYSKKIALAWLKEETSNELF